ncbi:MAG: hypothetical protein QMD14_01130 [Candidatus Aenigmarchaeota archaeon]|nr:hypothetical protein [Candidatus Aenigmarchaeota archaeon]
MKAVVKKEELEELEKSYRGVILSLLKSIDEAGKRIAGRGAPVFLREAGYALSDFGLKKLPKTNSVEEAVKILQDIWKKIKTVGEVKLKSIEEFEDRTEIIWGFKNSNCIKTVLSFNLEFGNCPLCLYSFYFLERTLNRILHREVEVRYHSFDKKTGICYEKVKILKR